MMLDFTDVDAAGIEVGLAMRMVFRIKEVDSARGFTRYFWKAAPARIASATDAQTRRSLIDG